MLLAWPCVTVIPCWPSAVTICAADLPEKSPTVENPAAFRPALRVARLPVAVSVPVAACAAPTTPLTTETALADDSGEPSDVTPTTAPTASTDPTVLRRNACSWLFTAVTSEGASAKVDVSGRTLSACATVRPSASRWSPYALISSLTDLPAARSLPNCGFSWAY